MTSSRGQKVDISECDLDGSSLPARYVIDGEMPGVVVERRPISYKIN